MHLQRGSPDEARHIAAVYKEAFPESVRLFFRDREERPLLDLLEGSFALVFYWGGKAVLAKDRTGKVCGYCLYRSAKIEGRDWGKLIPLGLRLLRLIKPGEAGRLAYNQALALKNCSRSRPVKKKEASIISLAVSPPCQGGGLGTRLLEEALKNLVGEAVCLNVRAQNPAARALYRRAGFSPYGLTKDLLGEWLLLKRPPS